MATQTTQSDSVPGQSTANTKVTLTTAIADALQTILDENRRIADHVETSDADSLAARLSQAGRVYVYGVGRSGLLIRMFAMRIMHLGKQTYVVGDTTTPAIAAGDLLIAISGSGTSRLVCDIAQEAKANGADFVTVLDVAADSTFMGALSAAKRFGKTVVADLVGIHDKGTRAEQLQALGVPMIALYHGLDEQAQGLTSLTEFAQVRGKPSLPFLMEGGITDKTILEAKQAGASQVAVGHFIYGASQPNKVA